MTKVIGDYDDRDVSLLAQDQYFRQVHWSGRLTMDEERALFARVQRGTAADGSLSADALEARDRLVEGYQGLVLHIASRCLYRAEGMELLDLVQEGNCGLWLAMQRYAGQVNAPAFHKIAGKCIAQAICDALDNRDRLVRLPGNAADVLRKARKVRMALQRQTGEEPTLAQVAAVAGVRHGVLVEYETLARQSQVASIEAVLSSLEEGAEEDRQFVNLFEQAVVEEGERQVQLREAVAAAVASLATRYRQAIELYYGLGEEGVCLTSHEVGQRMGIALTSAKTTIGRGKGQLRRALAAQVESVA